MDLRFVPILQTQRNIQGMRRDRTRFATYIRAITPDSVDHPGLVPLVTANPMARNHVTALLDRLLDLQAEEIAHNAVREAAASFPDLSANYPAGLVVVDDLMGGWTNRYAVEFAFRFRLGPFETRTLILPRFWVTGIIWSSETETSERTVRETMLTAVYRLAYMIRNGPPRTLGDMLAQEGVVTSMAGCDSPALDSDDLDYTREILAPHLATEDMPTAIACLFGDEAARSLGFTPLGLSHRAGLALALHDRRTRSPRTDRGIGLDDGHAPLASGS